MSFDFSTISNETRLRSPRIFLCGVEKIGKSTWAADSNKPIFLPIKGEEGVDDIKLPKFKQGKTVPQFPVCQTLQDVRTCLETLWNSEHDYETIVIDSVSTLEPKVWDEVCKKYGKDHIEEVLGGYHKGQNIAIDWWRGLTDILDTFRSEKNMSSIIIGHIKIKQFDDPISGNYSTFEIDLDKGASAHFVKWADAILFCNTKTIVQKEDIGFNKEAKRGIDIAKDQRFVYTQKRPSHPGGGRGSFGRLPYELPMPRNNPFGAWMEAVAAANAN